MADSSTLDIEHTCEGFSPPTNKPKPAKLAKTDKLLKLLRSKRGATIGQLQNASGWQAHSVRGFLSGTVKKRMGLAIESEADKSGVRRYRIAGHTAAAEA